MSMSLYDLARAGAFVTNLSADGENAETITETAPEAKVDTPAEAPAETPVETTETEVTVTETPEGEEVVDSNELETELLEVQGESETVDDENAKVEAIEEQIDDAEEAAVATEALIHNLQYTIGYGNGVNMAHAELVREHVNYIGKSLGWDKRDIPNLDYSKESFSTVGAISLTQESILQAAKNMLTKIIQSIIEGVNWVIQQGVNIWNKLFSSFDKMKQTAEKLRDYAKEKSSFTKLKEGHEMITTPAVKAVYGNETDAGLLPAIGNLREVATELTTNWLPMKIQNDVESLIDGVRKNAEGGLLASAAALYNGASHVMDKGVVQSAKDAAGAVKDGVSSAADKAKNAVSSGLDSLRNLDIKAFAQAAASGSLDFVKKGVDAVTQFALSCAPFVDQDLSKEAISRYGVTLQPSEAVKGSKPLPGNRIVLLIYPSLQEFAKSGASIQYFSLGNIASVLMADNKLKGFVQAANNTAKEAIGGIPRLEFRLAKLDRITDKRMEIKVPKMAELVSASEGLIQLCEECSKLKKHLDATAAFYKKVQRQLTVIKTALAVKSKFSGSVVQKALVSALKWIRGALNILREPGASFCSYMVGEVSQLGSVIRAGVDSYES